MPGYESGEPGEDLQLRCVVQPGGPQGGKRVLHPGTGESSVDATDFNRYASRSTRTQP
ncbi:hypothetical protein [Streptomyces atratus]|uniref:hypothetical protein n=1 Tax=Streptomyces atratus TaxID=1893 RepID=UPI003F5426B3